VQPPPPPRPQREAPQVTRTLCNDILDGLLGHTMPPGHHAVLEQVTVRPQQLPGSDQLIKHLGCDHVRRGVQLVGSCLCLAVELVPRSGCAVAVGGAGALGVLCDEAEAGMSLAVQGHIACCGVFQMALQVLPLCRPASPCACTSPQYRAAACPQPLRPTHTCHCQVVGVLIWLPGSGQLGESKHIWELLRQHVEQRLALARVGPCMP